MPRTKLKTGAPRVFPACPNANNASCALYRARASFRKEIPFSHATIVRTELPFKEIRVFFSSRFAARRVSHVRVRKQTSRSLLVSATLNQAVVHDSKACWLQALIRSNSWRVERRLLVKGHRDAHSCPRFERPFAQRHAAGVPFSAGRWSKL
jgi:hypothetical protein